MITAHIKHEDMYLLWQKRLSNEEQQLLRTELELVHGVNAVLVSPYSAHLQFALHVIKPEQALGELSEVLQESGILGGEALAAVTT